MSDPRSDDRYKWLTENPPVMPAYTARSLQAVKNFDYGCIEERIDAAAKRMNAAGFKVKKDVLDNLFYERDGLGRWVPEGSATGRMTISAPNPQPRPQFKWETGPAVCNCPLCSQITRNASGEEPPTPLHPSALKHANTVRQVNALLAEEEYYRRQAEEEARRHEEMLHYRVTFRDDRDDRSPLSPLGRDAVKFRRRRNRGIFW